MSLFKLARDVDTTEKAVRFLQDRGVLHKDRFCSKGHLMVLSITQKAERWRCNKSSCRSEIGIRKGTWLQGSRLPFDKIILFIYSWVNGYTSVNFCEKELEMASHTSTDWKNYLREVCADNLLKNPMKIGGEGFTVEIDESCFSRRKNNVGKVYPQQWVFGGVCRETKQTFLYAVPDRTAATLKQCIKDTILPKTTVISDLWKAYEGLDRDEDMQYVHLTVNHSQNFIDPISGAYTQTIESVWAAAKRRNKKECGTSRSLLDSYLCEFMYRQRYREVDLFQQIFTDIVAFWPPE